NSHWWLYRSWGRATERPQASRSPLPCRRAGPGSMHANRSRRAVRDDDGDRAPNLGIGRRPGLVLVDLRVGRERHDGAASREGDGDRVALDLVDRRVRHQVAAQQRELVAVPLLPEDVDDAGEQRVVGLALRANADVHPGRQVGRLHGYLADIAGPRGDREALA